MAAKKETTNKAGAKDADTGTGQSTATGTEQSTATGTEQSTATGTEQGAGDGGQVNGDGEGGSKNQGEGPAATSETALQGMVTVTLKTSFYCHEKEASFTAGDDYNCDAETAKRLISNNMAKI